MVRGLVLMGIALSVYAFFVWSGGSYCFCCKKRTWDMTDAFTSEELHHAGVTICCWRCRGVKQHFRV